MTLVELNALSPLLVLSAGAVLTLVLAAFVPRHGVMMALSGVTLVAFLMSIARLWPLDNEVVVASLLVVDEFSLVFQALLGVATLVVLVFSHAWFRDAGHEAAETRGLILLALVGACLLPAAQHFATLFMALELLSVCLFILIAWQCRRAVAIEAGIKYLVLAGLATSFMLFGMALLFAAAGTLSFPALAQLPTLPVTQAWWLAGLALLLAGVVFKLSLAPFHFWTPDVYQGASLPVTTFLATVSKVAVLGLLVRLVVDMELRTGAPLWQMLAVLAGLSMLAGNWLALRQDDLKRLLAYSSIAHMGYVLAALLVGGALAVEAVVFYGFFYLATTLAAFGVLIHLGLSGDAGTPGVGQLKGLARQRPLPALVMTLAMLSLAGVPLTAGFVGKFYVLAAGTSVEHWWLMALVVVGSAIGLFYYLRVILAIFGDGRPAFPETPAPSTGLCLLGLALLIIWLGVWPQPGMALAESLASALVPLDTLVAGAN